jgi:ribosomal protein S27AE
MSIDSRDCPNCGGVAVPADDRVWVCATCKHPFGMALED